MSLLSSDISTLQKKPVLLAYAQKVRGNAQIWMLLFVKGLYGEGRSLRGKMSFTLRIGDCFLRVPLVQQPWCLVPCMLPWQARGIHKKQLPRPIVQMLILNCVFSVDCQWGSWEPWSSCGTSCAAANGTGDQIRTRTSTAATNGGTCNAADAVINRGMIRPMLRHCYPAEALAEAESVEICSIRHLPRLWQYAGAPANNRCFGK